MKMEPKKKLSQNLKRANYYQIFKSKRICQDGKKYASFSERIPDL